MLDTFAPPYWQSSSDESLLTAMPLPVSACCSDRGDSDSYTSSVPPARPPPRYPSLTPAPEDLPSLPDYGLDGAFCSLKNQSSRRSSSYSIPSRGFSISTGVSAVSGLPGSENVHQSLAAVLERARGGSPVDRQEHLNTSALSLPQIRRKSAFTSPAFGMVNGRTPKDAWAAVAAKVVAANRFRSGLSKEIKIKDFKIEELGGRMGPLIFGPVAVFNGNVTLMVKKPLKRVAMTVTFAGVTRLGKYPIPFMTATHELFDGDLHEGFRSFLFGFNFPHVNLPPSCDNPLISYTFSAKLTIEPPPDYLSEVIGAGSSIGEILEYRSKNLHIFFMPSIDPTLEFPLAARQPSVTRKRSKEKYGLVTPKTNTHTLNLSSDSSTPATPPGGAKMPKPKLTLTTADLPTTASHNSTPVIDRPNPALISSHITRTTRITDDDNNTVARLRVELPKSRFLPGDEVAAKIVLQVRDGVSLPKGFGARILEIRYLAVDDDTALSKDELSVELDFADREPRKRKKVGPEEIRVLTGKKFVLYPDVASVIAPGTFQDEARKSKRSGDDVPDDQIHNDVSLDGGKEMVFPVHVGLPPFNAFISDSLLPTSAIPLGDPRHPSGSLGRYSPEPETPSTISQVRSSTHLINGKGKSIPSASSRPMDSDSSSANATNMYFVVDHIIQITVPSTPGSSSAWLKRPSSASITVGDLEANVPIILGNKNPHSIASSRHMTPELRLNAPEASGRRRLSETSSTHSSRSVSRSSRSNSFAAAGSSNSAGWRGGQRFLTMRETAMRPGFVED